MRIRLRDSRWPLLVALAIAGGDALAARQGDVPRDLASYRAAVEADLAAAKPEAPHSPMHLTPCVGGMAGPYPCQAVDLLEMIPISTFGATALNNVWGWTDPLDGREYALVGLANGLGFVDVTDPEEGVYLGKLPSHVGSANWRDVRVYQNHAYVVADGIPTHGMQVFDLTQLRNVPSPPETFLETAWYGQVGNVHTISINEATGYAYLAGSNTCHGGLHVVDLADPAAPAFAGCFDDGAYVHENQCFVYHGPDAAYTGHDICLAARGGGESLSIVDATNHAAPVVVSTFRYQPVNVSSYSHQAWFTEDHAYILLNDEFDERDLGNPTRTWIFDAQDLDALQFAGANGYFDHATAAVDHNLYVRGNYVFESNYRAGLRILELTDPAQAQLTQVGFFDVDPSGDGATFEANWGNYPFFASGTVAVSHRLQGLFLVRPTNLCEAEAAPSGLGATPNGDHRIDLAWTASGEPGATYRVERALGGCDGTFDEIADEVAVAAFADLTPSGQVTYGYRVRARSADGFCLSEPSDCVEASTTGSCTAPPLFAGLASAANAESTACRVALDWEPATSLCGGTISYSVYRGTTPGFIPAPANRIAEGVASSGYNDLDAPSLAGVHYVVRAVASANGAEDGNFVRRSVTASGPVGDGTFATGAEVGDPPLDSGGLFAPQHVGWEVTDTRVHGGLRSFWSTEGTNLCVTLEGTFELTAGQSSSLSFWTAWDIEPAFDGGVIDLSTNGGGTWTRLTPVGGYPGTITNGGVVCGVAQGSGAFTGYGQLAFVPKSVTLGAWAGQIVKLRWLYRSDSQIAGEGWWLDDIALTHTQIAQACSNVGIFVSGFEHGDLLDWTPTP